VAKFRDLQRQGRVKSIRPLSKGGIGNTIDQILGFPENNLPVANTSQWELKSRRVDTSSLVTLLHMEPEPRAARIVPRLLLPHYGWPDEKRPNELSFRQTLKAGRFTDRGFTIGLERRRQRVKVVFQHTKVAARHSDWLRSVEDRVGLGQLKPQPYWLVQDLALKVSTKMLNSFLVEAEAKREGGQEYFRIRSVRILQGFNTNGFMDAIESGGVYVDFDARTHHNHGTKFRLREDFLPTLYAYKQKVL
jgi:hypothetical protein